MTGATAIILARAGSKGVPGKNVALVAGRPCIAWTIEHAQQSRGVTTVAVSSDDPRALEVAAAMGAQVIERPPTLAHDTARIDDAARHASEVLGLRDDNHVAILYANVPVRPADLTERALALLASRGCDSVQSYARCGKHHPWWTARVGEDGRVAPWEGSVLNHGVFRRQDLPPAYVPDGGTMALRVAALMLRVSGSGDGPHAFFGRDRRGIETADGEVVDIDTRVDLLVADALLRERDARGHA
jgi:CMP-N-acetylneuraminic acid synthetase